MQLSLDIPGQTRTAILLQDNVVAEGIDIFSVNQKTIHIEKAGADFGEAKELELVLIVIGFVGSR